MQTSADIAAEAWAAAIAMFVAAQPDGYHRAGARGTYEMVSGAPTPLLSGVFSVAPRADAEEVAQFAASERLRGVPWSIQVRGERFDPRIADIAAAHDRTQRLSLPLMTKEITEEDGKAAEAGQVRVRPVTGEERERYQATMAAGFEGPPEVFERFSLPALMDHPGMRAYVAEVDGEPVGTSFGVVAGDLVGVFNIAVPPSHRRRGYGRAVTAAVLGDAYAAGARTAFLHASELGAPLYADMGFRLVERWTVFSS
ncbi:hypothetical protein Sme01_15640 [Sphaerisporangium melleum]|uniref:N-acetyltransferase domain-containing protein n=1 Tax=Sphaerisporangium melleum TaxID=321316 RepID=A0A917VSX8_9ACTN|nr:GNAT family N-acetyltransferase [Sphaerisporangium melleum]GGL10890.1 hypothetical protein GCM10007964_61400 [Sphaerisporangium melleum]GII69088.1 hypothetical protein Sme01_15640 [Sphaerisporangium melleum]